MAEPRLVSVISGEIALQIVAAIERAEHEVARRIENLGVVARQQERRVPIEAIWRRAARPCRTNGRPLARFQLPPANGAVLALAINQIGIVGIDATYESVAAADVQPILVDDASAFADRRPAPGAVVLQAADNPIWLLQADRHVIELAKCGRVDVIPIAAAVIAGVEAAVAAQQHVPAIAGIDPEGVAIGVRAAAKIAGEGQPAVGRLKMGDAKHIDLVGVAGIDPDHAEVHRPGVERIDPLPSVAAIVRAIDATVLVALSALLVLNVRTLTEVGECVRPCPRWTAGTIFQRDLNLFGLAAAEDRELQLIAGLASADGRDER